MQGPGSLLNVVTIPPGAGLGQRIVIDGLRGAVFEYDVSNNLVGSWASVAGTDPYGNNYPQGLSIVGSGIFSGSIIAGNITNTPIAGSTITTSQFNGGTMIDTTYTLDANGGAILIYKTTLTTTTITATGAGTFGPIPAGVTTIDVSCTGPGFNGRNGIQNSGTGGMPGGGAGAFSREPALAVTPGNSYNYFNGAGGAVGNGAALSDTTFTGDSVTVTAHAGQIWNGLGAGLGGPASGNSISFPGGQAGNGSSSASNTAGAGGGGAAANTGAGNSGGSSIGNGNGGVGGNGPGGHGGQGGHGTSGSGITNGSAGTAPGGGGGGAGNSGTFVTKNGGAGANGQIVVVQQSGRILVGSIAAVAGTDQFGNPYPEGFTIDNLLVGESGATGIGGNPIDYINRNYPSGNTFVSRANTTTPTDDGNLVVTDLIANAIYDFEALIVYSGGASNATEMKFQWRLPTGAELEVTCIYPNTAGTLLSEFQQGETHVAQTIGVASQQTILFKGTLYSGTGGGAAFQWSQNISSGTTTRVWSGSRWTMVRVH